MTAFDSDKATSDRFRTSTIPGPKRLVGEIRWFGGINKHTGRRNDYGFIAATDGDLYFHKRFLKSSEEAVVAGAAVVYLRITGNDGRPAAASVRLLTDVADAELVSLVKDLPAKDAMTVILSRPVLSPCEKEVLAAVSELSLQAPNSESIRHFWDKFPPLDFEDKFFAVAPPAVKMTVLSRMSDCSRVALLKKPGKMVPEDVLIIALSRDVLPPCENEALGAIDVLQASAKMQQTIGMFWEKFTRTHSMVFSRAPAFAKERALSRMTDSEGAALLKEAHTLTAEDVLAIVLSRSRLAPCEKEAFEAVSALVAVTPIPVSVGKFWDKFAPPSPKSEFFAIAPDPVKKLACRKYYSEFRGRMESLFVSINETPTTLEANDIYGRLDERDEKIAASWANSRQEGVIARMLSARAAEKAAMRFYERVGMTVEDISIRQLDGRSGDWLTHDLLVDGAVAVDVKNARRPVNAPNFYVEHTIPRFKKDRNSQGVKIAGVLSPYLNLEYIRKPGDIPFKVDELVFLGETSQESLDQLICAFQSPAFELIRYDEKTYPHWVFAYPPAWYREFSALTMQFTTGCEWPEGEEWDYVLDDNEKRNAITALCVSGKPLPSALARGLSGWQIDFFHRLQELISKLPNLPAIFLAVLTHFLQQLEKAPADFSPKDYLPLLYAGGIPSRSSFPLGVIDPLRLVHKLVYTITKLWDARDKANLGRFSSYRFGGMGILQAREKERRAWTTIIAYCGGMLYRTDDSGDVLVDQGGRPLQMKGKCGRTPLIIGIHSNCDFCGKLVCDQCGFCSLPCQQQYFQELAEKMQSRFVQEEKYALPAHEAPGAAEPRWDGVPLEFYEAELRKR